MEGRGKREEGRGKREEGRGKRKMVAGNGARLYSQGVTNISSVDNFAWFNSYSA